MHTASATWPRPHSRLATRSHTQVTRGWKWERFAVDRDRVLLEAAVGQAVRSLAVVIQGLVQTPALGQQLGHALVEHLVAGSLTSTRR